MLASDKIRIYLIDGKAIVFDPRHIIRLRTEHRICGKLVGSFAAQPRQNVFNGPPIVLLNEELATLLRLSLAEYVKHIPKVINRDPSQEINENELMQTMSQTEIPMDILLQDDSNKISRFERVTVDPSQFTTLRSRIFAHFWDLGFWITDGEKFGGDFLLYEQDPLECHAFALCFCCGADEPVGRWLIALGRLVRSVNKQLFLCFTGKDGKLNIQSIRSWSSKEEFKKQTND